MNFVFATNWYYFFLFIFFISLPLHITPGSRRKQKHHRALPTSTRSRVSLQSAAADRHLSYFLHMLQITTRAQEVIIKYRSPTSMWMRGIPANTSSAGQDRDLHALEVTSQDSGETIMTINDELTDEILRCWMSDFVFFFFFTVGVRSYFRVNPYRDDPMKMIQLMPF